MCCRIKNNLLDCQQIFFNTSTFSTDVDAGIFLNPTVFFSLIKYIITNALYKSFYFDYFHTFHTLLFYYFIILLTYAHNTLLLS